MSSLLVPDLTPLGSALMSRGLGCQEHPRGVWGGWGLIAKPTLSLPFSLMYVDHTWTLGPSFSLVSSSAPSLSAHVDCSMVGLLGGWGAMGWQGAVDTSWGWGAGSTVPRGVGCAGGDMGHSTL